MRRVASLLSLIDRVAKTDLLNALRLARGLAPEIASGRARLRVLLTALLYGSGRWNRPLALSVDIAGGRTTFVVPDYAGLKVLDEVFHASEYDVDLPTPPRVILDLGAHIGASILFFRRMYPTAKIIAVEANPCLAPILRANVSSLDVDVRDVAVAAESGEKIFYASPESWTGRTTGGDGNPVRVRAVALDDLLEEDVDFVKMDVEGEEFNLIPTSQRLTRVTAIVGEIHAMPGSRESEELLRGLARTFWIERNQPGPGVRFTKFYAVKEPRGTSGPGSCPGGAPWGAARENRVPWRASP
jgi:FkbM family methyltransferase